MTVFVKTNVWLDKQAWESLFVDLDYNLFLTQEFIQFVLFFLCSCHSDAMPTLSHSFRFVFFVFSLMLGLFCQSVDAAPSKSPMQEPSTTPRPQPPLAKDSDFKQAMKDYALGDFEGPMDKTEKFLEERVNPLLHKMVHIVPVGAQIHEPFAAIYFCKDKPKRPSDPCTYFGFADDTLHVTEMLGEVFRPRPGFSFRLEDSEGKKVHPSHVLLLTEHSYKHSILLKPNQDGIFTFPPRIQTGRILSLLVIAPVEDQGWAKWVWPVYIGGIQ